MNHVASVGRSGLLLLALLAACSGAAPSLSPSSSSSVEKSGSVSFPSPLVLSVLPFEDRTRVSDLAWLRKGLPDMLVAELTRNPSLLVVHRERLEEITREQAFQLSGRVPDDAAVRIGRLAGATVLVTGSLTKVQERLRIDAQLLDVERGTVLATAVAEGSLTQSPAVARSLVTNVFAILPASGVMPSWRHSGPELALAAQANGAGEALGREGRLFQALEAYERALAFDPRNPVAGANYARMVRNLSGAELLQEASDDGRIVGRLIERLIGTGLDPEIGRTRADGGPNGTVTLRIPVTLRISPSAVDAVVESVGALHGAAEVRPKEAGSLDLRISDRSELNREFVRRAGEGRRVYLRLLSGEGRTLAVYSRLRDWHLSQWVGRSDDQRARVDREKVLHTEAVVEGLTPDQVAGVAGVTLTVDPVPLERALVRLEMADAEDPRSPDRNADRTADRGLVPDPAPAVGRLRDLIEGLWNPPIVERPWSRGYLPGNDRRATVISAVPHDGGGVPEDARLVRSSGEPAFDRAALEAVRSALELWSAGPHAARSGPEGLRVRIHFQLVKDIPGLNLIGPRESADTVMPAP